MDDTSGDIPVQVPDDKRSHVRGSIGIDSGGSFTKIVYFRPTGNAAIGLPDYVVRADGLGQIPGIKPTNSDNGTTIQYANQRLRRCHPVY